MPEAALARLASSCQLALLLLVPALLVVLACDRRARTKVGARDCVRTPGRIPRLVLSALPAAALIPVALIWAESRPDPALACDALMPAFECLALAALVAWFSSGSQDLALGEAGLQLGWSSWSWDELDDAQLEGAVLGWRARDERVEVVLSPEGLELARAALGRRRPSTPA